MKHILNQKIMKKVTNQNYTTALSDLHLFSGLDQKNFPDIFFRLNKLL